MEATTAAVGSAVSKVVVYPLDLVKTRMATSEGQGLGATVAALQEEEGGLYRGIGPKLFKSVTGKFFYFYLYSSLSQAQLARMPDSSQGLSAVSNLVIGFFSEVLELPLIMPLEAIVSRVQASTSGSVGGLAVARQMYDKGGLGVFYVSLDAYVLGAMQPAIQMSVFDQMKPLVTRGRAAGELGAAEAFLLGTAASSLAVTATYPMDLCRTQAQTCDDASKPRQGLLQAMRAIVARDGVAGLFRGLSAQLFQSVLSAAIMLMVKERLKVATTKLLVVLFRALGFLSKSPPKIATA